MSPAIPSLSVGTPRPHVSAPVAPATFERLRDEDWEPIREGDLRRILARYGDPGALIERLQSGELVRAGLASYRCRC